MQGFKYWGSIGGGIVTLVVIVGFVVGEVRTMTEYIDEQIEKALVTHEGHIHAGAAKEEDLKELKTEVAQERQARVDLSTRLTRMEEALKWLVTRQGGEYPDG